MTIEKKFTYLKSNPALLRSLRKPTDELIKKICINFNLIDSTSQKYDAEFVKSIDLLSHNTLSLK